MNCPDWLHSYAQEIWPEVVDELGRRGRLLLAHHSQVVMFCQCLAQYRLATEMVIHEGQTVEEFHDTFVAKKVHPAFRVQAELVRQAGQLIKELGLNAPIEDERHAAISGLHHWLERARSGLQGERN